ncbi:MAG: presqualene diphosphate synthase HpnD [Proteobacteria bacterium]|nr:presqualene diphosphate synthase HpnD [Pseudomonadota bacterium]
MRILPARQREAMYQIYSFCRQIDDIADCDEPRGVRLAKLVRWRSDIDALYAGAAPIELRGLVEPTRVFGLQKGDFLDLIDGMEMDATGDIRAPDFSTLERYCDRVASAVGRLSVRVFGMEELDGVALAHHLGRALQLTNILRDLDEDAMIGRLYLPREALEAAGIALADPRAAIAHPNLSAACRPVIDRANTHFDEAAKIMARAPRRATRAARIMGDVYRAKLAALCARGFAEPRLPVRTRKLALAWIIMRNLVF